MAAKKPHKHERLTLTHIVEGSLRGHGARNELIFLGEKNSDPRLRRAIAAELVAAAKVATQHRDAQAAKASKPRGAIDGRTMSDLVTKLARQHANEGPRESWPHLRSAIEDWAGECVETNKDTLRYPYADGYRTITFKHFGELINKARRVRR